VLHVRTRYLPCGQHSNKHRLVDILKKGAPSPQIQYQCVLCFWLLSFVNEAAVGLHKYETVPQDCLTNRTYDIIPVLLDISKNALKEKVVRVCLATLRNMLSKAPECTILPMVGHKVINLCENFSNRKWADEEIKEDLQFLQTELGKTIQNLRYRFQSIVFYLTFDYLHQITP
jgi:V-type H+-transporting ATPase subunit H